MVAPYLYVGLVRDLIHRLKYRGERHLARVLSDGMISAYTGSIDVVVPVPLHADRQFERGFNQAAILANHLAPRLNAPIDERLLVRVRPTAAQMTLGIDARLANVRGAFAASESSRGLKILLVDDVCTTGATLAECARALRRAGATTVECLVAARAAGSPDPM